MSNKSKDIMIKNHTYYFFDDTINIQNFDRNNIKTDKKSYKYWICHDKRFEIPKNR